MTRQRFFDPGALLHRLSLQSLTETPDECGGVVLSWKTVAEFWGQLCPVRERSDLVAQQSDEVLNHEIIIRFREDVGSGWRILNGTRIFEIRTVRDPDERRRYLICSTREEGR